MAQITHARSFDGVSDRLLVDNGDAPTSGSIVVLLKRQTGDSGSGEYRVFFATKEGPGAEGYFRFDSSDNIRWMETAVESGVNLAVGDGWAIVAITKSSGAATLRFHVYEYTLDSWVHQDYSGGAITDWSVGTDYAIGTGHSVNQERAAVIIACAAVWDNTLSDGDLETLPDALSAWTALSPNHLWLLNQSSTATAVEDLIAAADQTGRTGTSVVAISDLPFEVGGSAVSFIPAARRG